MKGFQRTLDKRRAREIAHYVDEELGTIPTSIILSAQKDAELKIVGRGKTISFNDRPGAFLILDGQHRVYGFSLAKKSNLLRIPVVVYNGLTRQEESRLFIDINTKQKPVPTQLLLDIKKVADLENPEEIILREIFDLFNLNDGSVMFGHLSPFEKSQTKITRVTFNSSVKPLLDIFGDREAEEIYGILNSYLWSIYNCIEDKTSEFLLTKAVVFRAFMGLFPNVARRVKDKYGSNFDSAEFEKIVSPIFENMPIRRIEKPGTSWSDLTEYLDIRLRKKFVL